MTNEKKKGSLTVVGTGINALAHCSIETISFIENADIVYALVTDALTMSWFTELNPNIVDLQTFYQFNPNGQQERENDFDVSRPRSDTYTAMSHAICQSVREGKDVVAIFYGHPGVFVYPSHDAIRQLRKENYSAQMLPGISAEDCLFADLGIDPCQDGCSQYEATAFLFYKNTIDTTAGVILWQLGVLGDHTLQKLHPVNGALTLLATKLKTLYPAEHEVIIYEGANFPLGKARIERLPLSQLGAAQVNLASTLYIPAHGKPEVDLDYVHQMNLTLEKVAAPFNNFQPLEGEYRG